MSNLAVMTTATQKRRRERRPELKSEVTLPEDLKRRIDDTCAELLGESFVSGTDQGFRKTVDTVCAALKSLRDSATTPDRQLQLIPRVTEALRDGKVIASDAVDADLNTRMLTVMMETMVFPFLLDCRVRYTHRGLMSLLRATFPKGLPEHLAESLRGAYLRTLVHCWPQHDGIPCLFPHDLSAFVASSESGCATERYAESILHFLNCVDGLTSTLMPFAPSVFLDSFLDVLPLLGDCLQWSVANAISRRRRTSGSGAAADEGTAAAEDDDGAVFGEDLEHIRYCVRVVATYTHKYTPRLSSVWGTAGNGSGATAESRVVCALARMLEASILMQSSDNFPKDVLNATGLLVANALTVRTCDARFHLAVCNCIFTGRRFDEPASRHRSSKAAAGHGARLTESIRIVTGVVCSADPMSALAALPCSSQAGCSLPDAMMDVFGHLSCNGVFAFLKGILAHLSSPIRGDPRTVAMLLLPVPVARKDGSEGDAMSIAFDRIAPLARQGAGVIEEPEMRFMAIQTVDCIIRYIVALFAFAVERFDTSDDASTSAQQQQTSARKPKRAKTEQGAVDGAAAMEPAATDCATTPTPLSPEERELLTLFAAACAPSTRLAEVLDGATHLVMDLWDDGTQQMSGPLYETYDRVLRANQLLARFQAIATSHGVACPTNGTNGHPEQSVCTASVLAGVLAVRNERRGKYHAMLSLLPVTPLGEFLSVVCVYYGGDGLRGRGDSREAFPSLVQFARMLLSGASNHKVANISGDVFAKVTSLVHAASQSDAADGKQGVYREMLSEALLRTLALAILERGYIPLTSNVSESVALSNVVAHFAYPLLKHNKDFLALLVKTLLESRGSGDARLTQGLAEILSRARSSGIDIAAYLRPESESLRVVRESLQSINWDVRRIALGLCTQSTRRVEPVTEWQCAVMEQFLSLNMNLGGDTTARRELTTAFRLWIERVTDSYKNTVLALTKAGTSPANVARQAAYVEMVRGHWMRLASLFANHYGVTVELSQGFSLERRVSAVTFYTLLLKTVAGAFASATDDDDVAQYFASLFLPQMVEPLIADLSDSWTLLRAQAKDLLLFFCRRGPPSAMQALFTSGAEVRAAKAAAWEEVDRSQTYRSAEGAVARYTLLHAKEVQGRATAAAAYTHLSEELDGLAARTAELRALQQAPAGGSTAAQAKERRHAVYDWLQANPLHGRVSLCMELLTEASDLARKEHKNPEEPSAFAAVHAVAGNQMLSCCCEAIRLCSSLVGGANNTTKPEEDNREAGDEGAAAIGVVDCRGHVYGTGNTEAEAVMRRVVNNTWLSIRVATLAIHRVLKLSAIEALSLEQVRRLCYELMEALLLTKHNGVMSCVRGALKAAAEALVRCRDAAFYSLPGEMLDFLLGSEGVTSNDFYRMLRRSQGLPHAILAVLEAEDATVPFALFSVALKKLLSVARGDLGKETGGGEAPRKAFGDNKETVYESQRSNALNVLKFVFEDKIFADRSVAFIEDAFSLSTEGFNDGSWYIRNSSLMLYSSVLQRFVGDHPSTGGAGSSTSLHDIGKRTPRGVAFALRALTSGGTDPDGGDGPAGQQQPNLALFPILQMLSMLSPDPPHRVSWSAAPGATAGPAQSKSSDNDKQEPSAARRGSFEKDGGDTAVMVDAVARCTVSRNLMIRCASSVALTCLVPAGYVCDTISRIATAQFSTSKDSPLRLNHVHGGLLSLLQFHTHYVGTLRRNRRLHRLSSSANEAHAASVGVTVAEAVRANAAGLRVAAVVCPTVAAALLTLLHDLTYFAAKNWSAADASGASSTPALLLGSTAVFTASLVEAITGDGAAHAAALQADVGHAREAGALALLVCARLVSGDDAAAAVVDASSASAVRGSIGRAVATEISALDIAAGRHNVVSWMLDHLHYYCSVKESVVSGSAAFFAGVLSTMELLEGWSGAPHGIRTASLVGLSRLFGSVGGCSELGCVAWGEVVAHLAFAVSLAGETSPVADSQHVILQAVLARHVRPPGAEEDQEREKDPVLPNSEAQSIAIRYLACRAALQPVSSLPTSLIEVLSFYALPEQPMVCREAVVGALGYLLKPLSTAVVPKMAAQERRSVGLLAMILLRLIFDDLHDIREATCVVCSAFFAERAPGGTEFEAGSARDVMSNILSVILFLHSLGDGVVGAADVRQYLTLELRGQAGGSGAAENEEADDGDDGAEEEEVLFNKEADNMFIEESLLRFVTSRIQGGFDSVAEPPRLATLDTMMSTAASKQSLVPALSAQKEGE